MPDQTTEIETVAAHWRKSLYFLMLLIYAFTGWMFDANWRTASKASANSSDTPLRVLFIGNSFTYANDMPAMFEGIALHRQPNKKIQVSSATEGGYALWQHAGDDNTKNALMRAGPWDFVVLQDQSEMPLKESSSKVMDQWCVWFDKWIRSYHARPVLLMTWCDLNKPEDQVAISKVYRDIGVKLNAMVIPAGELMLEVTQKEPEIPLYDDDGHHPGQNGSYLVACLLCNMLMHAQSESVGTMPDHAFEVTKAAVNISEPIAKKLQKYADDFANLELKRQHLN
jgi:hypothetical protein